jgi:hypothetical protein
MKRPSVKFLPVGYPVYQAIAELNRSFDEATLILDRLAGFNLFHRRYIQMCHMMLEEIRALTNQEMTGLISDRELQNSHYFELLRLKLENRPGDPEDVPSAGHKESPEKLRSNNRRSPANRGQKAVRP